MTNAIETALIGFSKGKMDLEQLKEVLAGKIHFRYLDTNEREVEVFGPLPIVRFGRSDVETVIRRYLSGGANARDVSDWAATLRLLDCYELRVNERDPDMVWDVLDRLASPDAWGSLTTESAIDLLHHL